MSSFVYDLLRGRLTLGVAGKVDARLRSLGGRNQRAEDQDRCHQSQEQPAHPYHFMDRFQRFMKEVIAEKFDDKSCSPVLNKLFVVSRNGHIITLNADCHIQTCIRIFDLSEQY
ncbi:hypothetical protein E4U36_008358 [Claviceps purpurea]|nr:hypothetical protein E4U28_002574 [Claviceps purpurea]KAG6175929.1 hypothetical protein E4U36_008358 [Claviceps purpurea]